MVQVWLFLLALLGPCVVIFGGHSWRLRRRARGRSEWPGWVVALIGVIALMGVLALRAIIA